MSTPISTLISTVAGAFLVTAVLILWRREIRVVVAVLALQGVMLALVVGLLAAHERSVQLGLVALGLLALRAALLPALVRRALTGSEEDREADPLVGVGPSLLIAAGLVLLAYVVSRPLVALAASGGAPAPGAVPVGLAVVLIGFFVLVTRRRAVLQLVGFLVMDNGITAVGFLAGAEMGLAVELGASLDLLLAVLVLLVLTTRMRAAFGGTDLDDLTELNDR